MLGFGNTPLTSSNQLRKSRITLAVATCLWSMKDKRQLKAGQVEARKSALCCTDLESQVILPSQIRMDRCQWPSREVGLGQKQNSSPNAEMPFGCTWFHCLLLQKYFVFVHLTICVTDSKNIFQGEGLKRNTFWLRMGGTLEDLTFVGITSINYIMVYTGLKSRDFQQPLTCISTLTLFLL